MQEKKKIYRYKEVRIGNEGEYEERTIIGETEREWAADEDEKGLCMRIVSKRSSWAATKEKAYTKYIRNLEEGIERCLGRAKEYTEKAEIRRERYTEAKRKLGKREQK
jgi:hypothetical protein